jgi:hypothetical protein
MFKAQQLRCPRGLSAGEVDQGQQLHQHLVMQGYVATDGLLVPAILPYEPIDGGEAGTLRQDQKGIG